MERTLEYPPAEAREVVCAAFEETREILSYHDDGERVVGKTGTSLVSPSFGEEIVAAYEAAGDGTTVRLSADPILSTNVAASPDRYRDRVAEELDEILAREGPVDYARHAGRGKEVPRADDQRGVILGGKNYSVAWVLGYAMTIVVGFVVWSMLLAV